MPTNRDLIGDSVRVAIRSWSETGAAGEPPRSVIQNGRVVNQAKDASGETWVKVELMPITPTRVWVRAKDVLPRRDDG
jgi:hypothetical protein